jgi:hypothetical protein
MKITLCGSIAFYNEMQKVKKELEEKGHVVEIPPLRIKDSKGEPISIQDYYDIRKTEIDSESWVWERKKEAMKWHFDKVASSDAILVLNYDKNNIKGYIGANTLIEMGLAFHFKKKIFLLNDIPKMSYTEEILGLMPTVINGNLNNIS